MSLTVENLRQLLAHLPGDFPVMCGGVPVEEITLTDDVMILNDDEVCDDEAEVENPFGVCLSPLVRFYRFNGRLSQRFFAEPSPISLEEAVARAKRLTAEQLS